MPTFIKAKQKKLNDQTKMNNFRVAANITETLRATSVTYRRTLFIEKKIFTFLELKY